MASTNCEFIEENKKLFHLFRWSGILLKRTSLKWTSALLVSRLCWFLWHLLGTGLSMWSCKRIVSNSTETNITKVYETSDNKVSIFLHERIYQYIPFILLLLLFLGPIQGNIIKRNMEWFPKILKNIKKLEEMKIEEKKIDHEEDSHQLPQNNDLDSAEKGNVKQSSLSKLENCFNKCYNDWLPTLSISIFIILIMVISFIVAYKFHDFDDLLDEYKLVAVMFYLPLPWLTTLFVITLIKQITKLYEAIYNLKDKMFTDSENIEKVSDYLGLLQETVEIMISEIFEFTLGINFSIFVTSAVMCSYELIEGVKTAEVIKPGDGHIVRNLEDNFAEIDYLIPLFLSILPMFWVCNVTNHLMSNVHAKLRLRIRRLLPELYLQHYDKETRPAPEGGSDKPFKKLEFIYKTLKEWPPQVIIYGGWKVNYQLLSAISLFIWANSRLSL